MKQIVFFLLLFLALSSCIGQSQNKDKVINQTEDTGVLKLVKTYYLDKDSIASLDILQNEVDNYVMLQTKWHNQISSIAGEGNIVFVDENISLDTVFFEKNKRVYVLPTSVFGSTYGASVYFLIYESNFSNAWEIYRIPFDRLDIKTSKTQLSNIVRYTFDNQTLK